MNPDRKIIKLIELNNICSLKNQLKKYEDCGIKCLGMDTIAILEYNKEIVENVKF